MPVGAHTLLSFLAEPLKQLSESSDTLEDYNVSENLKEFQDWVCFNFLAVSLYCYLLKFPILVGHNSES